MGETLRVLSYNVHGGIGVDGRLDLDRVASVVRRVDPDVVGLQEVDRRFRASSEYEDQFAVLRDRLGAHGVFAPALEREPTDDSGGDPRQYGNAVLSQGPVRSSRTLELPADPESERRVLLVTDVELEGTSLSFATTHLGLTADERRRQAGAILDVAIETQLPQVLVGDFNAPPDSVPISALTETYVDAFDDRGAGHAPTFPASSSNDGTGESTTPERRIDYVFCTPDVAVRSVGRVHSPASDHLALTATLELPS
ncbi:endonuclease/exonuclease/phosphatase family protein [Halomicrococcus sp. SG-WS-1]|uniref:endonuclease/exonuclease/phosphatase family protein n=1 Tax=Halomicrococcus sp. SG-WS-1 TaxID=3439057 RepID=UPI003F79AD92